MRVYKISAATEDASLAEPVAVWVRRKKDISRAKKAVRARMKAESRMMKVEVVEFLTTVDGLLDFLNKYATRG